MFTEILESRVLMTAAGDAALSAAVKTDRLAVQVDLLKFRVDCLAKSSTILADILKIKADDKGQDATLLPLVKKMRTDLTAMWTQLKMDRLAEAQNVFGDEATLAGDRLQTLKDKGTDALTADHAKTLADRIKLQNDMVTGLNARIETRQADYALIFNDAQAIVTAAQNAPAASADIAKWANDRTTCMNTMSDDLAALVTDRTQLIADLTAQEST